MFGRPRLPGHPEKFVPVHDLLQARPVRRQTVGKGREGLHVKNHDHAGGLSVAREVKHRNVRTATHPARQD
eukprot:3941131-Rhodomonas_salina.3